MDAIHQPAELNVSHTEHDDGWTVAADLRPLVDDEVTVEVVGDTAIVAVDTPSLRTEVDVGLPDDTGVATLRNGVMVVEGTG